MNLYTAILYDIENLLKGNSFSQQMVTNLSLREIVKAIKQSQPLGQIAVHRAYANWSDPRLGIMRGEINELGIDPIQVFGFSRDQKKNAADIQLAIDAIDLAHVRPALQIFVIVSGDGGFASLAKKLHEYGKTVIGCAYQSATSKVFHAVCDQFVWIPDPEEEEVQEQANRTSSGTPVFEVTDPRNVLLASKIKKVVSLEPQTVFAKASEVLNWYASECRTDLSRTGIHLSVVQEGIRYAIPEFQSTRFGFPKFIEFMQFICRETKLCVARPPDSQAALFLRGSVRLGVEVLPDLESQYIQSVEGYRRVLAMGMPIFRCPHPSELHAVLTWLVHHPPEKIELGALLEETVAGLNNLISSEAAKLTLLSLVSAEAFERAPEGLKISEQKLTLKADMRILSNLSARLRVAAKEKLAAILNQVSDDILEEIIPTFS